MADPLYDLMNAGQVNPQMSVWDKLGPNAMSLLQGRPDQRTFPTGAQPGKIPYMEDPRIGGSILESLMAAGSAMPAGKAVSGAGTAGRMIPEMMQAVPGMPPGAAAGGATLASILGGTGGDNANAAEFSWADPNAGRLKRLEYLDKEIEKESTRRTPSAPGTQKARIDSLSREKDQLKSEQSQEYNAALEKYNTAETDTRNQAEEKRKAEAPFRERFPNAYQALPVVGWGTAAGAGALTGLKYGGSKLGSATSRAGSAVGGGLESAAFSAAPTVYDAETLPFGSKYQKEAADLIHNPDYWTSRVAPAAGIGAVAGYTGAKWGSLPRSKAGAVPPGGQPSGESPASNMSGATPQGSAPQGQPPSATVQAPKLQGSYQTYTTRGGDKVVQTPHGWQGVHPDTGKWGFVKKPDGPLERLMKGE